MAGLKTASSSVTITNHSGVYSERKQSVWQLWKYVDASRRGIIDIPVLGLNSEPILNVSSDWAEPSLRIYKNPIRIAWRVI
jgi:hypothetical protein